MLSLSLGLKVWRELVLFGVFSMIAIPCYGYQQPQPYLRLTEVSSNPVPDSFPVSGLVGSRDGELALWSPNASFLLMLRDGEFRALGKGSLHQPVGAKFLHDRRIEVVDAEQKQLVTFSRGAIEVVRPLKIPMEIWNAVGTDEGWFIAGADSSNLYSVYFRDHTSTDPHRIYQQEIGTTSSATGAAYLSTDGQSAIITLAEAPFTTTVVDSEGKVQLIMTPDAGSVNALDTASVETGPLWISLPVVSLGEAFVQTLADSRSDLRVFVLFDDTGQIIRRTEIVAPLGFAGSLPSDSTLIAVRRLEGQEIVRAAAAQLDCEGCEDGSGGTDSGDCLLGCPVGDESACSNFCVTAPGDFCGASGGCDDGMTLLDGTISVPAAQFARLEHVVDSFDDWNQAPNYDSFGEESRVLRRSCDKAIVFRAYSPATMKKTRSALSEITL